MGKNRIREIRQSMGITIKELSDRTGISARIHMSFRKRYKKKSVRRCYAEYSKSIRKEGFRGVFLGVNLPE